MKQQGTATLQQAVAKAEACEHMEAAFKLSLSQAIGLKHVWRTNDVTGPADSQDANTSSVKPATCLLRGVKWIMCWTMHSHRTLRCDSTRGSSWLIGTFRTQSTVPLSFRYLEPFLQSTHNFAKLSASNRQRKQREVLFEPYTNSTRRSKCSPFCGKGVGQGRPPRRSAACTVVATEIAPHLPLSRQTEGEIGRSGGVCTSLRHHHPAGLLCSMRSRLSSPASLRGLLLNACGIPVALFGAARHQRKRQLALKQSSSAPNIPLLPSAIAPSKCRTDRA